MLLQFLFSNMRRCFLWCLVLLYTVSVAFSKKSDITKHPNWSLLEHRKCGNSNSDRIIGGKNASLGAYPWIAQIGYKTPETDDEITYRCGGTLINPLYVITAAHCVTNLPDNLKVSGIRLGEHNTLTNPDCEKDYCADPVQDFLPKSVVVHKNYDKPLFKNDIAIIRLNKPVVYSDDVRVICMMGNELLEKNFVGEKSEVAGWGIYDINDPQSSIILQTVKLPIVEIERCQKHYKIYTTVDDKQMCVGGVLGQDSCGGDSGGPLMKVESQDGMPPRYFLIGIVSFGAKYCGSSTMPAVYTSIAKYITWILDHMSP